MERDRSPQGFSWQMTKQGLLMISRHGTPIMTLKGTKASELMSELEGASESETQMILAVATGNYRRGNEGSGAEVRQRKGR